MAIHLYINREGPKNLRRVENLGPDNLSWDIENEVPSDLSSICEYSSYTLFEPRILRRIYLIHVNFGLMLRDPARAAHTQKTRISFIMTQESFITTKAPLLQR